MGAEEGGGITGGPGPRADPGRKPGRVAPFELVQVLPTPLRQSRDGLGFGGIQQPYEAVPPRPAQLLIRGLRGVRCRLIRTGHQGGRADAGGGPEPAAEVTPWPRRLARSAMISTTSTAVPTTTTSGARHPAGPMSARATGAHSTASTDPATAGPFTVAVQPRVRPWRVRPVAPTRCFDVDPFATSGPQRPRPGDPPGQRAPHLEAGADRASRPGRAPS